MLKKIALLIALMYSVAGAEQTATLDPGQVYNTGNIVNWGPATSNGGGVSPWINSVYQQSLTCWGPGGPGNCGPYPTVRPDQGAINFSYGMTDIHQIANIANVLPNTSTGLRVNGYNFAFFAKNGNGWDNGQQDYLTAYVKFYDNKGSAVVDNQYNLNYQFNWTYFNFNKTFDTPYASKDLSTVQYGFVGMDSNFWAGTYGPEIYNISFNLKYSVDPCATNPMYSPTCPGYLDALNKLLPPTIIASDPIITTTTSGPTTTTITTDPVVSTVSVTGTTSIGQVNAVASVVSAPAPSTSTTSSSTNTSSSSSTQTKETNSSSSNTSLALSLISKNQDKEKEIAMSASQNAIQAAEQAGAQAQQEAVSVASQAVANSVTAGSAIVRTDGSSSSGRGGTSTSVSISIDSMVQSNQSNQSMGLGPAQATSSSSQQQEQVAILAPVVTSQVTSIVQMTNPTVTNNNESNKTTTFETPLLAPTPAPVAQKSQVAVQTASIPQPVVPVQTTQEQQSSATTQSLYTLLPPQQSISQPYVAPIVSYELFTPEPIQTTQAQSTQTTTETVSVLPPNFVTDKSNPLTDIIENKQNISQNSTIATIGSSVNRSVGDNEVAGGVDLNKMALAPAGYNDYLNFTLRDAAFYAPKEVYKNQRNVDNARLLRLLTNDSKHKELVELQYAK